MSPILRLRATAVLSSLLLSACGGGGDGGTEPDPDVVASVAVSPSSAQLGAIGATAPFTAQARNAAGASVSGKTFNWTSENETVATVSGGTVTAVGNGTATIRATVAGETVSGTATVTVLQAVSQLTVAPTTATIVVGGSQQLTPTARDAGGATIASPGLTWSSSNNAVASVSTSGLVTGVGAGSATITVSSGTVNATASVTVNNISIAVGQDTTISGTVNVDQFTVGAGRIVTVSGPLTLNADGLVTIAGTLTGSCVGMTITGDTAVVISGIVANGCDNGTPANLSITADGELDIDGATITSSGDITLRNDPDVDETDFTVVQRRAAGPGPRALSSVAAATEGVKFTRVNNSTVKYQGNQGRGAGPNPAKDGTNGVTGTPGENGRPVKMFLNGNAVFAGSTTLWGQDGGRGGHGQAPASLTDLTTTGGAGGQGGKISVFVTGRLTYSGANNIVRAGRGGAGGDAAATTLENAANGGKGPNATATGGAGGEPGIVDIRAGQGIEINPGALTVEMFPGAGGAANAVSAKGADATVLQPAQEGGNATATGGRGGHTPDARLTSSGVTGAPDIVADGANGGEATANAGNGGNGLKPNKNGAMGGTPVATGGDGGNARTRDQNNVIVGLGGNGGNAFRLNGHGGNGWADCVPGQEEPGGDGGAGASAGAVTRGRGGTGFAPGTDGTNTYDQTGNGGNGGRGFNGGAAGRGGAPPALAGGDQIIQTSYTDGLPGADCPPAPPPETDVNMRIDLPVQNGAVTPGTYLWALLDNLNNVIGSIPVEAAAPATGHNFTAQNPTRIGWSALGSWIFHVVDAIVDGAPFDMTVFGICIINSSLDGANPVLIEELDKDGKVIATTPVTTAAANIVGDVLADGPGCPDITLQQATTKVKVSKTGKGSFADGRGGRGKGKKK